MFLPLNNDDTYVVTDGVSHKKCVVGAMVRITADKHKVVGSNFIGAQ